MVTSDMYLDVKSELILERKPMQELAGERQLVAYPDHKFWQSMDNYQEFMLLNQLCQKGKAPRRTC